MGKVISSEVSNRLKKNLKTQLSLTIALVVAVTVFMISIIADILVNERFKDYLKVQQDQKTKEIVSNLSKQYNIREKKWNIDFMHTIGMYFLYDGYIIKVYDNNQMMVWDAEVHDMSLCNEVMSDIASRMHQKYPNHKGIITSQDYPLLQKGLQIGTVSISYYGPFFLDENDFNFINALNIIILSVGGFSLIISIVIGWLMAKRISRPITKAISITQEISEGNYDIRFTEQPKLIELKELATSIHQLEDSLKRQEELRKQLTADVAHELRTPLATIGTHIEAMIEGIWEPSKERLNSCYEEIQRISKLVLELEKLAKVESQIHKLNKSKIDLFALVTTVCTSFELEAKNKNISLITKGEVCEAYVDEDKIKQVVFNLVSNAIKYTRKDGHIMVTVCRNMNFVEIMVIDDGIGIPHDEIPYIFERFYRADKSRNRKTGGAGIGLAIVKSIVMAHSGLITVDSQIDKGSQFVVKLHL